MAEAEVPEHPIAQPPNSPPPEVEENEKKVPSPPTSSFSSLSLSIWPPSQRTRDAVLQRLVETLTTTSFLSQRYGAIPSDEAPAVARQIEEEAFAAASGSYADGRSADAASAEDDGIEILQIYSKEISRRMLDTVKTRAAAAAATPASPMEVSLTPTSAAAAADAPSVSGPVPGEEISFAESESSQA